VAINYLDLYLDFQMYDDLISAFGLKNGYHEEHCGISLSVTCELILVDYVPSRMVAPVQHENQ